jgi:Fur family ferric uptake transcriptional regulator
VPRPDLKKAGLRKTGPRLSILRALEKHIDQHLSADELYRLLTAAGEDISLATVYRVLTQFEAAGLVVRHNFEGGHSVFELETGRHHDHMVCLETGRVVEFMNDDIERLQREIAEANGFELVEHSLILYVRPKRGVDSD